MLTVRITTHGLDEVVQANELILKRLGGTIRQVMAENMAKKAKDKLAAATPVATGDAQKSWGYSATTGRAEVYNESPHYKFLREGTGLYGPLGILIRPQRTKIFDFYMGDKHVKARYVRGIKPHPEIEEAVTDDEMVQEAEKTLDLELF